MDLIESLFAGDSLILKIADIDVKFHCRNIEELLFRIWVHDDYHIWRRFFVVVLLFDLLMKVLKEESGLSMWAQPFGHYNETILVFVQ